MLLVEYTVLDNLKVINETTESGQKRLKLRGRFQKCDEQNNNGRIYPRKILESQVQKIQEKINDRSLVGALDHPANDAIHLSQASHLITGLSVDKSGDVIGECEILSTPNGKIVESLINDGVKIGISSRGVGSVSEGREGKIVNEDFKLITFDLVSDPSTKGAYPELTESIRENSQRAQEIVSKHKKDRVLVTLLESKINEAMHKTKVKKRPAGHQKFLDSLKHVPPKPPKPKPRPTGKYESEEQEFDRGSRDERSRDDEPQDPKRDLDKLTTGVKKIKTKGKKHLYRGLPRTVGKYGTSQRAYPDKPTSKNDSVELFGNIIKERCWKGYEPTPGVEPYAKGSCKPKGSKKKKKREAFERLGDVVIEALNSLDEGPQATARRKKIEGGMSSQKLRVDVAGRRARAAQVQADQDDRNVDYEAGEGPTRVRGSATPGPGRRGRRG